MGLVIEYMHYAEMVDWSGEFDAVRSNTEYAVPEQKVPAPGETLSPNGREYVWWRIVPYDPKKHKPPTRKFTVELTEEEAQKFANFPWPHGTSICTMAQQLKSQL